MADFGDIAGGISQGLNQGIRTIAQVQQINLLKDTEEREKNKFDVWKRNEEEAQRPIFLDNLPVKVGENVKAKLRGIAETQGLINRTPDGREFVRAKHGKELYGLVNSPALLSEQMADLNAESAAIESQITKAKGDDLVALQTKKQEIAKARDTLSMQSKDFADMIEKKKRLELAELESVKKQVKTFDQVKGEVAEGLATGKKYPDELMKLLGVGKYAGTGGTIFDTGTGKVVHEKAEKGEKLTGLVGINPKTGKEEYLMTDNSFSGTAPGSKPGAGVKVETPGQKSIREKRLADAAAKIDTNSSNPAVAEHAEFYNTNTSGTNAYIKVPGVFGSGIFGSGFKYKRVTLPKNTQGKQITMEHVRKWQDENGGTIEDILAELISADEERKAKK
jgi:hypothetical protein